MKLCAPGAACREPLVSGFMWYVEKPYTIASAPASEDTGPLRLTIHTFVRSGPEPERSSSTRLGLSTVAGAPIDGPAAYGQSASSIHSGCRFTMWRTSRSVDQRPLSNDRLTVQCVGCGSSNTIKQIGH